MSIIMFTWNSTLLVVKKQKKKEWFDVLKGIKAGTVSTFKGVAVYFTGDPLLFRTEVLQSIPYDIAEFVRRSRAVAEKTYIVQLRINESPDDNKVDTKELGHGVHLVTISYGYALSRRWEDSLVMANLEQLANSTSDLTSLEGAIPISPTRSDRVGEDSPGGNHVDRKASLPLSYSSRRIAVDEISYYVLKTVLAPKRNTPWWHKLRLGAYNVFSHAVPDLARIHNLALESLIQVDIRIFV
jgi:K+ transporter